MKRSEKIKLLRGIESGEVKLSDFLFNLPVIGFFNTGSSQINEYCTIIDGQMKIVSKSVFEKLKPKMILLDLEDKDL